MKNTLIHFLFFHFLTASLSGQVLDAGSLAVISLKDGTSVLLSRDINDPTAYYYLPRKIQLSCRKNIPEISLMIYRNSQKEITGGILHVLMTWGLTQGQESELQQIINQRIDSLGLLKGAADITLESGELEFDQKNVFARGLEKSSNMRVRIPTQSMHKTAASFDLSPLVARFLADEIQATGQSGKILMKSKYHYTVGSPGQAVRIARQVEGEMNMALASWIKALKQYKLVKVVMI